MQPQGRGRDLSHLPVQVSLSDYPMSDWTQKPSWGHGARALSLQSVSAGGLMRRMSTGQ